MQTDFQQIGENQFLITVPDADNINHIVVFLTGTVPFPDGMGGAGIDDFKNILVQYLDSLICITVNFIFFSIF